MGSRVKQLEVKNNSSESYFIYKVPEFVKIDYSPYYQLRYLVIDSQISDLPPNIRNGFEARFLADECMKTLNISMSYFMICNVEVDKKFSANQMKNLKEFIISLDYFDSSVVSH